MTDTALCRHFEDDLAALALGTLTGRARAATIAHVESCPACERTLRQLSTAADRLLELAPSAEPPAGFEARVLGELGRRRRLPPPRRRLPHLRIAPRRLVVLATAAVIVAVLGFLAGDLVGTGSPAPTTSAALTSHGRSVGELSLRGGTQPRLDVRITALGRNGPVVCKVTSDHGHVVTVGIFWLYDGSGSWTVALPFPAKDLRSATIATETGAPLASSSIG